MAESPSVQYHCKRPSSHAVSTEYNLRKAQRFDNGFASHNSEEWMQESFSPLRQIFPQVLSSHLLTSNVGQALRRPECNSWKSTPV